MHNADKIKLGGIVSVRDKLIKQQSEGRKVFRLESGDPSFDIPPHVVEAIVKAVRDGHTHYTAGAGILPLRIAACSKMRRYNKIEVNSPTDVFVTNGAMHALFITFAALCEPGDEVIVPDPTWTETADNVTMVGGTPVRVDLDENYRYLPDRIEEKITTRTRAIVINSPHNPTGMICGYKDISAILHVAANHGLWVISDEAYEHVIYDGQMHISPGSFDYDRVISIFSFSKSYAMSGLRLGYFTVSDPLIKGRIAKLLRCTINGVNSATQHGGVAALEGPQDFMNDMIGEYTKRRNALIDGLSCVKSLQPFKPGGAFYVWCKVSNDWFASGRDSWDMTNHLINEIGVGSAPGSVFGPAGENCIRFAFSCSTDQVLEASRLLKTINI